MTNRADVEIRVRANDAGVKQTLRGDERALERLQRIQNQTNRATAMQERMHRMAPAMRQQAAAIRAQTAAIGVPGALLGAGAAAYGLKEAVTVAANFQAAMNRVRAALNTTAPEFESLSSLAKQMGRTTQYSANESASAIEMLAKNGLTASQILGGALKTSMLVAASSGSDLSSAADLVTDIMADFHVPAGQMEKAADGVTGVLLQSKFGIDDYRLALAQAGGVAGGLGVTMGDFNTTIAATSSAFASGSDAGTSFKTFLSRLVPASKPAARAMKKLDLHFFDANGGMKSMGEIAQELQDGLKGLSDQARNEYLQDIFGTDAIRTAIMLAKGGQAEFDKLNRKIGEGKASEQAAARMAGFWGELEKAKSALEGLGNELGTMALPGLEKGLVGAQEIIDDIQNGLTHFEATLDIKGLDQAKAAVGELIKSIGNLMGMGGGEGSTIENFFDRMANSANLISDAVNAAHDFAEAVGIATPDKDTPEDRKKRYDRIVDNVAAIDSSTGKGVLGKVIKDIYDESTGRNVKSAADQEVEERRKVFDYLDQRKGTNLPEIPYYLNLPGNEEALAAWKRRAAGPRPPTPGQGRMDLPGLYYPEAAPGDLVPRDALGVIHRGGMVPVPALRPDLTPPPPGSITAPPLTYPNSAPSFPGGGAPIPVTVVGSSGPGFGPGDMTRPGEGAAMTLGSATDTVDVLRAALDQGGSAVAQGGQKAGEGISQGAQDLISAGRQAGAAIGSEIRSALQTPVNIKVSAPSAPSGTGASGRKGVSSTDAGVAQ